MGRILSPPHPRGRPGWARVPIAQLPPRECSLGSSHGAPSSGWDPLLGRAIRITLGKILIIVASKAPPLAGAGPCPGNPNNQHHWHFSHPRWGGGSHVTHTPPRCFGFFFFFSQCHFLEPSLRPAVPGRLVGAGRWAGLGVSTREAENVKLWGMKERRKTYCPSKFIRDSPHF